MKHNNLYSSFLALAVVVCIFILFSSMASAFPVTYNVVNASYKCDSWSNEQFPFINMFGDDYVPLISNTDPIWKSHVGKLAKLILDSKDINNLNDGEKLDLGRGYTLQAKQVDVNGKKVWLEFDKGGQYVDDSIIAADSGDHTWICRLDKIQGEDNIPVLRVHVNQIYQGETGSIVQIDGIWLIDYANAMNLHIGDKLEGATLTKIILGSNSSDLGSLVFEVNSMPTKKIIVPKYEHHYMEFNQQTLKQFEDQLNNTPVLDLNKTMSENRLNNTSFFDLNNTKSRLSYYWYPGVPILDDIPYNASERNQGNCENCWIWSGTAALEGSHSWYNGYNDRLSIQFADSGIPTWNVCRTGWPMYLADFYNNTGFAVPWSNMNARYLDASLNSSICENTHVPFNSIATNPNYKINGFVQTNKINGNSDKDYISQIKAELNMHNPVMVCIFAPNQIDMRNYFENEWNNGYFTDILDFSKAFGDKQDDVNKIVGHCMVIAGYHEDLNPSDSYWIVLNSWGAPDIRPDGTFLMAMYPEKGYNAKFKCIDSTNTIVSQPNVMNFFAYSYNNNSIQAFVQEPAKPVSLEVDGEFPDKKTGQTRVEFIATDMGYPNRYNFVLNNNIVDNGNYDFKDFNHRFEFILNPGTYNPHYSSQNSVGGMSAPIYLKQPLVIKNDPVPIFSWQNPVYCPIDGLNTGLPTHPEDIVPVHFIDQSWYGVNKWYWEFGDGNTSDKQDPTNIYPHNGSYQVNLTVWNNWGEPKTLKKFIEVYWGWHCHPLFIRDYPVVSFKPDVHIGEVTINVLNPFVNKALNLELVSSQARLVNLPEELAQKVITQDNLYAMKYVNTKILSPSASACVNASPSTTSVNGSFDRLETTIINQPYQTYNKTAYGPQICNTTVLTPILSIEPRESVESKFSINTSGLYPGDYQFTVAFKNSSTQEVIDREPIFFKVLGIPKIQVTPMSLDFGTLSIGQINQRLLTITNIGNVNLSYNITIPQDCSASGLQGVVPAFDSKTVTLSVDTAYAAQEPFSGERNVILTSNSSTSDKISIPVKYKLNSPCASLVSMNAPSSLNANEVYTLNVTMHNAGSIPWDSAYTLGVPDVGDAAKFVRKDARPELKVNPGENATYQLTLHAPSAPGDYMMALEMYYIDSNNVKHFFGWPIYVGITVNQLGSQKHTMEEKIFNLNAKASKSKQ